MPIIAFGMGSSLEGHVNAVNGGVALNLLVAGYVDGVVLARSVLAPVLIAMAVGCCLLLGRRALHAEGLSLHLRWRDPAPAV